MKHFIWIGWILLLALSIRSGIAQEDLAVLLEKAIYTEETLGNLGEAAKLYQQIAANSEAGRTIAAQALFRLGM